MKNLFLLSFWIILFSLSLKAQENNSQASLPDNPNAPEITFDKLVHDYGNIRQNSDGSCEFEFTNTGKEPLILSNVRSTCGCTVPSWPKEPILPGQKEKIKIQYNTGRIGPINKSVTVTSNAKNSMVVLFIKGNVNPVNEDDNPYIKPAK
jgi:hypothetical protein